MPKSTKPAAASGRRMRSAAAPAVAEPESPPNDAGTFFGACEVLEFTRRMRAAGPGAADPDAEEEVFDVVLSTENPVLTPWGSQVLGHGENEVDLSQVRAGISFLLEHGGPDAPYRVDPHFHAGHIDNLRVESRKLRGELAWGNEPDVQAAKADFIQGKRKFMSIGWAVGPSTVTKVTRREGQPDLVRRIMWRPCEASSVSVPADFSSRKGRSGPGIEGSPVVIEGEKPIKEDRSMKKVQGPEGALIDVPDNDERPAVTTPVAAQRSAADISSEGRTRASQIVRTCKQFGVEDRAVGFIESELTVPEVCGKILETRSAPVTGQPGAETIVAGVPKKDAKRYSILRAIRCAATGKFDGFEGEMHAQIEKQLPSNSERHGGILVPLRLQDQTDEDMFVRGTRALGSGIADGGATLVTDTQLELIDILRNAMMCSTLGARTLSGLVGSITFPKKTSDPTVQRMQENPAAAAGASNAKYGWVLGSPKTYIGVTVLPRQLMGLTSFDVEADSRSNLIAAHGLAFDLDAMYGSGAANTPLGIYTDLAVQTQAMGGPETYPNLIKMVTKTASKNALRGSLGFMTTSANAGQLLTTLQAAGVASPFVWQGALEDGRISGYRAVSTNQMSAVMTGRAQTGGAEHGTIFGPWDNLLFLLWGALEIQVDPITLADKGQLKLVSFLMGDVVNQRPEAFVVSTGATVA